MSRPPNDSLHAQVSKGHRPEQAMIDALEKGAGRATMGTTAIQEMTAKSALNDFTMGDRVTGIAWSVNPYVGCLHACRYCFVPNTMHVERGRWGEYVIAKHNLPALLRTELEEKPRLTVYISTSTDPYQPIEAERRLTRSCLQVLARKDWPVDILTRGPLVTRDIGVLRRFSRLRVGMSVPTLDENARRIIEPNAPPVGARFDALRKLADAGLTVYANYAPAYPPTGGFTAADVAHAFKAAGVQWVNTSVWRYQQSYLAPLWDRVHRGEWAQLARFVANPVRQSSFRTDLDRAFAAAGLRLRTGFFNEPMHTPIEPEARHRHLDAFGGTAVCADDVPVVSVNRPCS